MDTKPAHLTDENAAAFEDADVVATYPYRATYPPQTIDILRALIRPSVPKVLDAGTGTGDIARPLSAFVAVDAVDSSAAMLALGRRLAGDNKRLRWIQGRMEDAPLDPPYGLVTAGQSLHWMDWTIVLPLFRRVLAAGGVVAIVDVAGASDDPWAAGVGALVRRFSTMQNYQSYDLATELERRRLFRRLGSQRTAPFPYTPTVEAFIASFHARASLTHARMGAANAASFDAAMRDILTPHARDGRLHSEVAGVVEWGEPLRCTTFHSTTDWG